VKAAGFTVKLVNAFLNCTGIAGTSFLSAVNAGEGLRSRLVQ